MTAYELIKLLGFPEKALADKKVFKKAFYENAGLTKQQMDIFKKDVNELRWYYALKQENINISAFKNDDADYAEVQVIGAILRDDKYAHSIAEIVQKAIQYPVILAIEYGDKTALNVAHKRVNKADTSKSVVDEIYNSGWIGDLCDIEKAFLDSIKIKNLSFANFYEFYQDFVDRIKLFAVCAYKREYKYVSREKTKELYDKYFELIKLEEKLQQKKREIKNESDFSKKVPLNVVIKELEQMKEQHIHKINI